MTEAAPKHGPKAFIIETIRKIEASGYSERDVKQGLKAIKSVTDHLRQGLIFYGQLETRIENRDADAAVEHAEQFKYHSSKFINYTLLLVLVVVAIVAFAYIRAYAN